MKTRIRIRLGRGVVAALLAFGAVLAVAGCERQEDETPPTPVDPRGDLSPAPRRTPATTANAAQADQPAVNLLDDFPDEQGAVTADRNLAKVIQTLPAFDHPAASALSLDGTQLFVANSSMGLNGYQYAKGSVSKLEIQADGRLKMLKADFITQLHAPLGIAVSPRATKKFPAGSLFVSVGTTSGVDEKGERIVEIKRFNTGVMIFDPANGRRLGYIPMGTGFAVSKRIGLPTIAPAGLCFDPDGNLYVADTANTGKDLEPPVKERPQILRLKLENIDAYSENREEGIVSTFSVRQGPMAIYYCPLDDGLYWTTLDGGATAGGGVYRMMRKQFPLSNEVANVLGGEQPLMGIVITPNGGMIVSRVDGDLKLMTGRILAPLVFTQNRTFSTPMGLTVRTLPNGQNILYVPEQQPAGTQEWGQRLRVVLLPSAL